MVLFEGPVSLHFAFEVFATRLYSKVHLTCVYIYSCVGHTDSQTFTMHEGHSWLDVVYLSELINWCLLQCWANRKRCVITESYIGTYLVQSLAVGRSEMLMYMGPVSPNFTSQVFATWLGGSTWLYILICVCTNYTDTYTLWMFTLTEAPSWLDHCRCGLPDLSHQLVSLALPN